MKKIVLITGILFSLLSSTINAQQSTHISGNILARLEGKHAPERISRDLAFSGQTATQLRTVKQISKFMNIWLFEFDPTSISENEMLRLVKAHPNVLEAQFNHKIENRETLPDDPNIGLQWQWKNNGGGNATADADVDAELAWDITTGGLTALGDTIVVCVVDDGIALNHPDLKDNLWVNHGEIQNDGIDNDNNGYIDDYNGWNINSDDDNVGNGSHGVNVAGMIGAKGNNGVGITGINWNVKIMTVRYGALVESEVIEAYDYPLAMRKLYNITNGNEGAFVVVTNSSWGIDNADPAEFPLWCGYYDTLGVNGILSCGATTNGNADVDLVGDMPTACPSDYMISVGRTTKDDSVQGGFGATQVDLGAPGVQIYTTSPTAYTTTTGTSFSSPLVAGIVALMYSAPCADLASMSKTNPSEAALLIKKYLLDGVDKKANMTDKYLTGGRANAFNSLQLILEQCGACQAPSNIIVTATSDTTAKISWTLPDSVEMVKIQYRLSGTPDWTNIDNYQGFAISLDNLTGCTEYEIQLASYCSDSLSNFTTPIVFKTLGCCTAVTNVVLNFTDPTVAELNWDQVFGTDQYFVNYKISTELNYTELETNTNQYKLVNLLPCTNYEYFIKNICKNGDTITTDTFTFKTKGCGSCDEIVYCESFGSEFQEEWISNVTLDGVLSDSENDGYKFFESPSFILNKDNPISISITPSYSGNSFDENFRAWIDYNQDGDFDDTDELVFDPGADNKTITGSFIVPTTALEGTTRMRISMSFAGFGADKPESCDEIIFGEVEDYCVSIPAAPSVCAIPVGLDTLVVEATDAKLQWSHPTQGATSYTLEYKPVSASTWTVIANILAPPVSLTSLISSTLYEWRIKSICLADSSDYSEIANFKTENKVGTATLLFSNNIHIYPNPVSGLLNVDLNDLALNPTSISIQDLNGMTLFEKRFGSEKSNKNLIDVSALANGMYLIVVQSDEDRYIQKLIKQ